MSGSGFEMAWAKWIAGQSALKAVVQIGSQVRREAGVNGADAQSDWDYQVITADPGRFATRNWVAELGLGEPVAYAYRPTFGGVKKVTLLLADLVEVDLVVLTAAPLQLARVAVALGLHRRAAGARRALADLAIVIRPGYRFVKGEGTFGRLYARVVAEVADPRLSDAGATELAESVACDVVWARRKRERGELVAVQRILHVSLAETNFRLLHELKLRRGEPSFPEARRLERVATSVELNAVTVASLPALDPLGEAVERAWTTTQGVMAELVPGWRAPAIDD